MKNNKAKDIIIWVLAVLLVCTIFFIINLYFDIIPIEIKGEKYKTKDQVIDNTQVFTEIQAKDYATKYLKVYATGTAEGAVKAIMNISKINKQEKMDGNYILTDIDYKVFENNSKYISKDYFLFSNLIILF